MSIDFKYVPVSGDLSGRSFEEQTARAFNELGMLLDESNTNAGNAVCLANNAVVTANDSLNTAQSAVDAANSAMAMATNAQRAADSATTLTEQACELALVAGTSADNAQITADAAVNQAGAAQSAASEAQVAAGQAVIMAQSALDAVQSIQPLPVGVITMWSGALGDIPSGWALCDGTGGTPDLRDRFVVGAGNSYGIGATGGANTHSHTVTVNNTTLSVGQMPAHNHESYLGTGSAVNGALMVYGITQYTPANHQSLYKGDSGAHNHTASAAASANVPLYYALAFIMRVA